MEEGGVVYRVDVGVDVAAETCVAAWLAPGGQPGTPVTHEQTPAGFAALQRHLRATASPPAATLVVLEATGNSWVARAVALHEAGYRVAAVNPRQAHHFAKAQLRRAETDALDARDLALLAAAPRPAPWTPVLAVYSIQADCLAVGERECQDRTADGVNGQDRLPVLAVYLVRFTPWQSLYEGARLE